MVCPNHVKRNPTSQSEATSEVDHIIATGIDTAGNERLPRRLLVFILASTAFALACAILALKFFVAERIPELTENDLNRAKKLWQEHSPANYDMDIEIRGKQPGNVHVEVRKRVVTAETRDGRVPPERTWDSWSVPGMLDILGENLQNAEDAEHEVPRAPATKWQMRCEFDSELGIPRRYHQLGADVPEVYWRVTRFDAK
jgi:hypothetical protein